MSMNCLQATTRLCQSSPGHDFFTGFANPRVINSLSLTYREHKNYRNSLFRSRKSSSIGTNNIVPPLPAHNSSMEAAPSATTEETVQKPDPVVQYIVLRKDLVDTMKWPLGSVISQGCHAAVAAIWIHKDDPVASEYCSTENLNHMHKVTLEVKGETQLRNLAQKLETGGVAHKLWMEQPENFPTCLATKPYRKSELEVLGLESHHINEERRTVAVNTDTEYCYKCNINMQIKYQYLGKDAQHSSQEGTK